MKRINYQNKELVESAVRTAIETVEKVRPQDFVPLTRINVFLGFTV